MNKFYRVQTAQSAKQDIKDIKVYILRKFTYREVADNFSKNIKCELKKLDTFPDGYQPTEFIYRGYLIYIKPWNSYHIFYVVDESKQSVTVLRILHGRMNWQDIIGRWIQEN